jgi:hypothetical protein
MSKRQALKAALTLDDVASLLGFKSSSALAYVLYKLPPQAKYKSFVIPKRFGGTRSITAPLVGLKVAQERLSDLLQDCAQEMNVGVATVLAQIACYENALPQGSPCSPVISNLIAHMLDMHCVGLAAKFGCTYSRYADDRAPRAQRAERAQCVQLLD